MGWYQQRLTGLNKVYQRCDKVEQDCVKVQWSLTFKHQSSYLHHALLGRHQCTVESRSRVHPDLQQRGAVLSSNSSWECND